jgi:hypothetical protein
VVGEDAQRALVGRLDGRQLATEAHERRELVGLEDRRHALLDHRHAVETQARVDVLAGQRRQLVDRVLVVLHEDEVPVLQEALVLTAGQVVGLAPFQAAVEVQLRARTARAGRPRLPEVVLAREQHDALARHPDRLPRRDRLLVGAQPQLGVAREDGDPDVLGAEAEALQRQLPGQLDGALLEVVADREVAEHLEEREVPRGRADVLDVGRAEALLARRQAVVRGLLEPEEVRLERVHARGREQDRGVERGRDQRARGQAPVVAGREEAQERLADLVGRGEAAHASIVAHPTTTSPASSTAV